MTAVEAPRIRYQRYSRLVATEPLPAVLIDLDLVDRNIAVLVDPVRRAGRKLRLASKSIRSAPILRYLLDHGEGVIAGLLCYSPLEAARLYERGFDDLLVAYPTNRRAAIDAACRAIAAGASLRLTADCRAHLDALEASARDAGIVVPVVLDADMSDRALGGAVHIGVRRSPLRTAAALVDLAREIERRPVLRFAGILAYEAQIAGMGDRGGSTITDAIKHAIKRRSRPHVRVLRGEIEAAFARAGIAIPLLNGGGTGSISWSSADRALTEVSAGSGFLGSHLFDRYRGLALEPAQCFALEASRSSDRGLITCAGGGYVASGEIGIDRLPEPYLPPGLRLTRLEGAGEVQTPLILPPDVRIELGDPVFFRHAKSGELMERFNEVLLIRGDRVEARARTYRGEGWALL